MGRRANGNVTNELVVLLPASASATEGNTVGRSLFNMETRSSRRTKLRGFVGVCIILALAGIVYVGYFCPDHVCALTNRDLKETARITEALGAGTSGLMSSATVLELVDKNSLSTVHQSTKVSNIQGSLGYDDVFANDTFQFDINAHDVMVFLHIQKTGQFFRIHIIFSQPLISRFSNAKQILLFHDSFIFLPLLSFQTPRHKSQTNKNKSLTRSSRLSIFRQNVLLQHFVKKTHQSHQTNPKIIH